MRILDLSPALNKKLIRFGLSKKFVKTKNLFEMDPRYPSLHTELLEPKELSIYSLRIDRKYRAHFIVVKGSVEILDITLHYQK